MMQWEVLDIAYVAFLPKMVSWNLNMWKQLDKSSFQEFLQDSCSGLWKMSMSQETTTKKAKGLFNIKEAKGKKRSLAG